ncbi:antitoxin HicB [Arthrobacter alpinus]|uniref:helix-turn-helix domain-containing protein n=1 Tax=Arthrobacter alpinus TaxID=656366 RepID=UPI0005CA089F|nr:helix-turn-helix transcriptional regulator [Arthrobacter alpinus]ALV47215.1 antitoxin HicB [Arthrobacter alpinus]
MSIAEVGKQLRAARMKRGWSQTDLAEQAGVSRPTIARVESGQDISTASLEKIVVALELVIDLRHSD